MRGERALRCEEASKHLPRVIDGVDMLPPEVAAHVESCLRCQVESIRYRKVARTMRQMRGQLASPNPDLAGDILSWVEAGGAGRSRVRLAVYVAAAATAATAAGAAGAIVLVGRSRRGRLALAG